MAEAIKDSPGDVTEPVESSEPPAPESAPESVPPPPPEPGPAKKDDDDNHPEFKKRIGEFRKDLGDLERKLVAEQQVRIRGDAAFKVLADQNKLLTDQNEQFSVALDKIEDKVSDSGEPDIDADPRAYADWREERLLKRMEKLVKPAVPDPIPTAPPSAPQQQSHSQDARETVQMALHDDYQEMVDITAEDMKTDRVLYNDIWRGSKDPYKAGYAHGVKRTKMKNDARQGNLNQAYAEEGVLASGNSNTTRLTDMEKLAVQKIRKGGRNITEDQYLKSKQRLAARRGREGE